MPSAYDGEPYFFLVSSLIGQAQAASEQEAWVKPDAMRYVYKGEDPQIPGW
jgi:hypothetical protein